MPRKAGLIDELLSLLGGRPKPVMARLIESGKLTMADVKEAETGRFVNSLERRKPQ